MKILALLLFAVLPLGQLEAIPVVPGVTIYLHDVVLAIMALGVIPKYKILSKSKLFFPGLAFICAGLFSLLINYHSGIGFMYLIRWTLYFSLYFVVLISKQTSEWWMKGLLVTGILFAVLGILQYIFVPDLRDFVILGWDPHFYRLTSTFFDPNFASLYIVLTMILSLTVLKKYPKVLLITFCVLLVELYLTKSRSGLLAMIAGVGAWIVMTKQWKVAFAFAALVLLLLFMPKSSLDVTDLFRIPTTDARLENWRKSAEMFMQAPIAGSGFGVRMLAGSPGRSGAGIDNSVLYVLVGTGIIGLAAYFWFIFGYMRTGRSILVSSGVAVFVHSMFNNSLFYAWIMMWMMILAGATEKITDDT